jgi:hypothetical protein
MMAAIISLEFVFSVVFEYHSTPEIFLKISLEKSKIWLVTVLMSANEWKFHGCTYVYNVEE